MAHQPENRESLKFLRIILMNQFDCNALNKKCVSLLKEFTELALSKQSQYDKHDKQYGRHDDEDRTWSFVHNYLPDTKLYGIIPIINILLNNYQKEQIFMFFSICNWSSKIDEIYLIFKEKIDIIIQKLYHMSVVFVGMQIVRVYSITDLDLDLDVEDHIAGRTNSYIEIYYDLNNDDQYNIWSSIFSCRICWEPCDSCRCDELFANLLDDGSD